MTFDAHGIRSIMHGPADERRASLRDIIVWFCAAAFATATLLSVFFGWDSILLPVLAGIAAAAFISLVKIR